MRSTSGLRVARWREEDGGRGIGLQTSRVPRHPLSDQRGRRGKPARSMFRFSVTVVAGGGVGRSGQWQRIKHGRRAAAARIPVRITPPSRTRTRPPPDDAIFALVLSFVLYVVPPTVFANFFFQHFNSITQNLKLFFINVT